MLYHQVQKPKIYIIHNLKLQDRKANLLKMLDGYPNIEWIEIEKYPNLIYKNYTGKRDKQWEHKCENLWCPPPPPRELTYAEIACTASHIYAWQMALNDVATWSIFIEDDAIFENDFIKNLNAILFNVPNYADVLFIGGGFPHEEVSLTLGKVGNFIIKHHPATNTAVGYAIRNRVLKKLLRFDYFDLPIDYEFAYLLQVNNCIVIHMENYGIREGSKNYYKSSIR